MLVWLVMFMLVCELNGTGFWLWPLTGYLVLVFGLRLEVSVNAGSRLLVLMLVYAFLSEFDDRQV